jgi:hypothetical protein
MVNRAQKIAFGEMRCADHKCSHSTASADPWPDDVRLSDIAPLFARKACGKKGADVRPDFN